MSFPDPFLRERPRFQPHLPSLGGHNTGNAAWSASEIEAALRQTSMHVGQALLVLQVPQVLAHVFCSLAAHFNCSRVLSARFYRTFCSHSNYFFAAHFLLPAGPELPTRRRAARAGAAPALQVGFCSVSAPFLLPLCSRFAQCLLMRAPFLLPFARFC